MNRYQPPRNPPALAFVALAMTALTLTLAVLAPTGSAPATTTTSATDAAASPVEVLISPARLDIVAVREAKVAADDARVVPAQRGHSS